MRSLTSCVILMGLLSWSSWAAIAPLALSDAIERAKSVSPERTAVVAKHEALTSMAAQAMAPPAPSFAFGLGDLAAPPSESGLRTYQLTQGFGFPGKAIAQARSFEFEANAVIHELRAADQEVAQSVKDAFYRLWLSKKKLELNQLRRTSFEKILKIANRRFVKNTTTEVEYLTAKAALQGVDNEKADFTAVEKTARAHLNVLLAQNPDEPIDLIQPPTPLVPFAPDRNRLRNMMLGSNPALAALGEQSRAVESRVTEAKRNLLPDFKLSAGTNSLGAYSGTVQLTFPLWFWWNERRGIQAAEQNQIVQEAQTETEKRHLTERLETLVSGIEALSDKLVNYHDNLIPTSDRAFTVALANYGYGKIDFPTLTGATNSHVNSRIEYEALLTDFLTGLAQIESVVGGPAQ